LPELATVDGAVRVADHISQTATGTDLQRFYLLVLLQSLVVVADADMDTDEDEGA
jgi:hypothetical protein